MINNILKYFPEKIEKKIAEEFLDKFDNLEEIRIRASRPIILKLSDYYDIRNNDINS